MQLGQYLCLGGVEVVNACRTSSYLRNIGHPYLASVPDADCGCVPQEASSTTVNVVGGFQAGSRLCGGVLTVDGDSDLVLHGWTIDYYQLVVDPCPDSRPAMPPLTDPGWVHTTTNPIDPTFQQQTCISYEDAAAADPACYFVWFKLTSPAGLVLDVGTWWDLSSVSSGVYGNCEVTFTAATDTGWEAQKYDGEDVVIAGLPVYVDPVTDDAPWYDPAVPESADVLGVWLEEFTPSSPLTRGMQPRQWGGTLGFRQLGPREFHLVGYVYASSCAAAAYAEQWLLSALDAAGCYGGPCGEADAIVAMPADCDGVSEFRTVKRVGLVAWNGNLDSSFPCQLGFKFEATLSAEVPYLYRDPVLVADFDVIDGAAPAECNICSDCRPATPGPCSCGGLTQPLTVPKGTQLDDGYCAPVWVQRRFFFLEPPYLWTDATARITLTDAAATPEGLRNLRIVGFPNPLGYDGDYSTDELRDYISCSEPCLSIEVACMPAGSELVIDGTTRTATLSCGNLSGSGYPYLSSNSGSKFRWPDVGCTGLIMAVEFDPDFTDPATHLLVEVVPRETR